MASLLEQSPAPSGLRDLSGSALQLARSLPSDFDVSGYPTIYFCPAGKENAGACKVYDGERTSSAMSEYIDEARGKKIEL